MSESGQSEEAEYLSTRAKGLRTLLWEATRLAQQGSLEPEDPGDRQLSQRLARSVDFYIREMDKSLTATAFLAANVMGASALESILMLACLRDRAKVAATKKWVSLQARNAPKPFPQVLAKARLSQLLAIAEEMAWFPRQGLSTKLRTRLVELVGSKAVGTLQAGENPILSIPQFMVAASAAIRNCLHPARASAIPVELMDYVAMVGCAASVLALGLFLESQEAKGKERRVQV